MQANYNPKIIAGATFPTIEVPTYNGDMTLLGKPENGHDWKMVMTGKWWLFTEVNTVPFAPNTSIS